MSTACIAAVGTQSILFVLAASCLQLLLFTFCSSGSTQIHIGSPALKHFWASRYWGQNNQTAIDISQNSASKEFNTSLSTQHEAHSDEALTSYVAKFIANKRSYQESGRLDPRAPGYLTDTTIHRYSISTSASGF
jgi:hypothetical protein